MKEGFEGFLEKYGRASFLKDAVPAVSFKAFIQPLRYKNKMYLDGVNTIIGFDRQNKYLYIGPAGVNIDLSAGEYPVIICGEREFIPERSEEVYLGGEIIYRWAIVREVTADE